MNIERLLVIEPHPDDLILMCGGTVRKLRDLGKEVYAVTFTNGGAVIKDEERARSTRKEESRRADEILGITEREILDYSVRGSWDNNSKLYNELLARIRRIHPDTIITMNYDNKHPDHMFIATFIQPLVFQAGEEGVRPDFGDTVKPRIFLGENPRSPLVDPDFYFDITGTVKHKKDALRTQTSQRDILGERIFEDIMALAAYRAIGMDLRIRYCEAFKEVPVHYKHIL